jgi:hypothetical protein
MSSANPRQPENEQYKADATVHIAAEERARDSNNDTKVKEVEEKKKRHDQRGETFLASLCTVM